MRAFRKLLSVYVFSYFPFGIECRIWDLILSVPDHCLSFYLARVLKFQISKYRHYTVEAVNNKGADQTARMRRLICAFVVRRGYKKGFLMMWPIYCRQELPVLVSI